MNDMETIAGQKPVTHKSKELHRKLQVKRRNADRMQGYT